MKNLPAREKLDIAEKVAQYLVLVGTLDKNSALEDYDRANELSLELAMLLPATIYRHMVEGSTSPTSKLTPASVAILLRAELLGTEAGDLEARQIAVHEPGSTEKPRTNKTH